MGASRRLLPKSTKNDTIIVKILFALGSILDPKIVKKSIRNMCCFSDQFIVQVRLDFQRFLSVFSTGFFDLAFGKGMRSRKVDSVKIVLTLEREHENQGLQRYKTCSKIVRIDVNLHANSSKRFVSDFYLTRG